MWALRILTGPQTGQLIELKLGRNQIGRSSSCDIKLSSPGVSKEHTEIMVFKEKIVITDLKSSNGTYLNGVRIQTGIFRLGDKLGIHDILADVIPAPDARAIVSHNALHSQHTSIVPASIPEAQIGNFQAPPAMPQPMGSAPGMPGMQGVGGSAAPTPAAGYKPGGWKGLVEKVMEYLDRVALPGVYKLPQLFEFKFVLLGFVVLFIFSTTLLSMIPMVAISRASIVSESKRRAGSIARSLATINQAALLQNSFSALTTNAAESEEGVQQVLIVQQSDGMILAPASRAGTTPDLPFVHTARREMRPQSVEVSSSTIGASFPIGLFDPNTGEQSIKAHAIVLYDISSLAFDDGRAISLFMQTLVIASLIGLVIFFFMYKLIEYPIVNLNSQLDSAMREKTDNTVVSFQFPALQALVGNINSLLTRYIHGSQDQMGGSGYVNIDGEAENLMHLIGYPCIAIAKDGRIISCNQAFTQVARTELVHLQGQSYKVISDIALQQNIEGLISKSRENSLVIHSDQLEFSGHLCQLSCQGFVSSGLEPDYFVITVAPAEGGTG